MITIKTILGTQACEEIHGIEVSAPGCKIIIKEGCLTEDGKHRQVNIFIEGKNGWDLKEPRIDDYIFIGVVENKQGGKWNS